MNTSLNKNNEKEEKVIITNYDTNQLTTLGNNEKYRTIKETITQQKRLANDVIKNNKSLSENINNLLLEAKALQDDLKENQYETRSTGNETNKNKSSSSNRVNSLLHIEKEINDELKIYKDSHKQQKVKQESQCLDNKDK